ncbi:PLP-dependent transferase [Epithele typhae]|uniref:PLP-dependent transferase n=1 Tax=Epithele typhae TaxID=378194 RepID=UPI002007F858|nr:PLP-dependent transferase [Epithele typhae]KAH9935189.1 PLP-dependent transferase [Epithele typhae]
MDRRRAPTHGLARLDRAGESYVDYMGGSLYPDSLVRVHAGFLQRNILGNTHSVSNPSRLSAACAAEARQAVLDFFHAPPGYTVVFTANASGALKLVGEAFPFGRGSAYVLCADAHNSVHGLRRFASARGADVCYVPATDVGGCDAAEAEVSLPHLCPPRASFLVHRDKVASPRVAGTYPNADFAASLLRAGHPPPPPPPLARTPHARSSRSPRSRTSQTRSCPSRCSPPRARGLRHAPRRRGARADLALSLAEHPVDALAVSFYKMFGFPTGVGALVARTDFLERLERPWFAGGTVDVVQAPGTVVTMAAEMHERFEDGTINYLGFAAVTDGLRFLSAYLPFLPIRLSSLTHYLIDSLESIRHDVSETPVVRVLSRKPGKVVKSVGEQADTGSTVAVLFLAPSGEMLPNSFIEHAATASGLALRTGCMCNPGGAAALLGLRDMMASLPENATYAAFEAHMGRELGVVRLSLGLASDWRDVWRVLEFARAVAREDRRAHMWAEWIADGGAVCGEAGEAHGSAR